jgi:hypothetical protein
MKKYLLIFLVLPFFVSAQNEQDTIKYWKKGGVATLNLSQISLTNWVAGGKSSATGVIIFNSFANYQKEKISWDNTVDLSYGFQQEKDDDLIKSSDKIDLSSKLGIKTKSKWNYSFLTGFKSQFSPGYAYPNTTDAISKFMAPGYLNLALGMDYKTEKISLLLSPLSGKFTFVTDDLLSDAGAFGVDPGSKARSEMGASLKFEGNTELLKNVTGQTKLELFSNYFNNPQNIDVDWKVLINMKVNEFLSANIVTHLIYDDDIDIPVDKNGDGVLEFAGPKIQFMEMFGVGLSLKF